MDTLTDEEITLLNSLTEKQKSQALALYAAREKKTSTAYIFWVLFSCHYFYLGKPWKNVFLWLLMCCLIGEIWWLIDAFRMSGLVRKKNFEIIEACIHEAKALYPDETPSV